MMITRFLTPVSIILANLYRFKKFGENNIMWIMWNSPWKRKENAKLKCVKVFRKIKVRKLLFFSQIRYFVKEAVKEDRNTFCTLTVR